MRLKYHANFNESTAQRFDFFVSHSIQQALSSQCVCESERCHTKRIQQCNESVVISSKNHESRIVAHFIHSLRKYSVLVYALKFPLSEKAFSFLFPFTLTQTNETIADFAMNKNTPQPEFQNSLKSREKRSEKRLDRWIITFFTQ